MSTQGIAERHFYAATTDELEACAETPTDQDRLEAQNELVQLVAPDSERSQGYTNAATFRAIMTAGPSPDSTPSYQQEPDKFAKFFTDFEGYRYAAGEPYAFSSGTGKLNYLGIVLGSQYAEYGGESLVYSIRKIAGQSIEQPNYGERIWGQILMYHWRAGVNWDGLSPNWTFNGVDEVGVMERAVNRNIPVIRAGVSSFPNLIGMPAIRKHYRDKDPSVLDKLPEHFEQVRRMVGELALMGPGESSPPVNDR